MIAGSCHCGAVKIAVAEAPATVTSCNCSICRRLGTLWAYCIFLLLGLSVLEVLAIPALAQMPSLSLMPDWSGPTLFTVYLLQASLSISLEKRFEPHRLTTCLLLRWC